MDFAGGRGRGARPVPLLSAPGVERAKTARVYRHCKRSVGAQRVAGLILPAQAVVAWSTVQSRNDFIDLRNLGKFIGERRQMYGMYLRGGDEEPIQPRLIIGGAGVRGHDHAI